MNKFLSIAALALAAVSVAQAGITESDVATEVGQLMGRQRIFEQFCLDSYEYVRNDLRARANHESSKVFNAMFGATTEIADEVLNVQKEAVAELAKQVAQPEAKVSEGPLPEDQILSLIEQGKREIQQKGLVGRVIAAGKSAANVMYSAANSALFIRLAKLRSIFGQSSLVSSIKSACQLSRSYEEHFQTTLEQAKEELAKEHDDPELQKFIATVGVRNLKCFTLDTFTRVSGFCDLLKNGSNAFIKMLGFNASVDFSDA